MLEARRNFCKDSQIMQVSFGVLKRKDVGVLCHFGCVKSKIMASNLRDFQERAFLNHVTIRT